MLEALKCMTNDLRAKGTRGRMRGVLEGVLRDLLPDDIAERARGRVHVAVTRLTPPPFKLWPLPRPREVLRGELVTDFADRDDFIAALLASCYIRAPFRFVAYTVFCAWSDARSPRFVPVRPAFYFDEVKPGVRFRGSWCTDGGLTRFLPVPPRAERLVRVTCFPDLNGIGIAGGAIDIAPSGRRAGSAVASASGEDALPPPSGKLPKPYGMARLLQWALTPASDEVMDALVRQGAGDAERWARATLPPIRAPLDDRPAPVASARGNGA